MDTRFRGRTPGAGPGGVVAAFAAALLVLAGCDNPLTVEDTENVTGAGLGGDVDLLVNRALADFQVGYSGGSGDDRVLSLASLMTDEFFSSGTFTTRTRTDQREQFPNEQGNTSDFTFGELNDARTAAADAAAAIAEQIGTDDPRFGQMASIQGYTIVAMAENYCGAIPLSTSVDFGPGEEGQPLSTRQTFERAVERFDAALAGAAPGTGSFYLASVGKARAQLGLGQVQQAASTVAEVPTDFIFFIEHSDNTADQENPIFTLQGNGRYSLSDQEGDDGQGAENGTVDGGNGIAFRHKDGDPNADEADPRVPWVEDPGGGFSAEIPLFLNLRYRDRSSGVVLADGIEARLIEAEAAVLSGDLTGAETILNDLRANVTELMAARYGDPLSNAFSTAVAQNADSVQGEDGTLGPLDLDGLSQAEATDVVFRERAFWLFNTGHRLGDLRRLLRDPYNRLEDDVFPTGDYLKGGTYGDDVAFWIPFEEENNTQFDSTDCDVTQP